MIHTCKECGLEVSIKDGLIERQCSHTDSPVLASMSAVARGAGGTKAGVSNLGLFDSLLAQLVTLFTRKNGVG